MKRLPKNYTCIALHLSLSASLCGLLLMANIALAADPETVSKPPTRIEQFVSQQLFPAEAAVHPDKAVTRAHFAVILTKALKHNTRLVSEFPVYSDVPLNHWAYAAIETSRERKLIGLQDLPDLSSGEFKPDTPLTRMELFRCTAHALAGKLPSPELSVMILKPYSNQIIHLEQLSNTDQSVIAKLINARLITLTENSPLQPDKTASYADLASMVDRIIQITSLKQFLLPKTETDLVSLPAGQTLKLVPNGAIFKQQLVIGTPLFFTLTEPVTFINPLTEKSITLPKGSHAKGEISSALSNTIYQVTLSQIQTPDDQYFQTQALLALPFPSDKTDAFIVPGDPIEATTLSR